MSEQKTSTDGLMKIGELAKAANVNVSTLKFYVKEELIRPALKTGRNMSWYSPDCVATIRAIRMLQRERFYPLSVIKHLLSSSGAGSPPAKWITGGITIIAIARKVPTSHSCWKRR